ncbi:pyruvate phosphate dikinase PEP/pyruvate-binding [Chthoniobacter flavus Ellin428]|uniref:Pyruvate phosphate dikinase PEP/pyruvate-binding n=1 Tax=Chthoniobacter flavus Ellin428 TaxID=497964 RepID=B4D376_9BACT|nr:PEP/pyruvate-binding domain-containing protein [Chthoniobacter flavus]EDY19187.1 pyruvate phosphate dikinase PEP/pyruvate-binding [Chthoniobacter flavus Ellin428]TCO88033.1 pyruvate,water dikinase [Chthoniobacter flavus]
MPHTLRFDDPLAVRLESSGGKGANLSVLTQRGFPVPRGFIVTAPVYEEFIRDADEFLRRVATLPCDDAAALRKASLALREEIFRRPLPLSATKEIERQLAEFPCGTAFSVRSSSTMEDLAGAAFAGQHETFLNVVGLADVLQSIRGCYGSLWADRAIAYRRQQGFDHSLASMAVVVQQMVPGETAGVGFSINPINGQLGEMVINANFGLGESVVSGEGEVDQWILEKSTRAVRSANIGTKSRCVVSAASGTREVHRSAADAEKPSLDERQLAALADLLIRVEASYAFPQDIEWAFADGYLWLLQSRPITTIPPRWTRDESAERFPNVITPLTWDFVESGFHRSLNHSFRLLGFPTYTGKWFAMFDHYIYGNQNGVELYARRAPFAVHSQDDLRAAIPQLRQQFGWVQDLPVAWMRDLDHYLVTLGRFKAEALEDKTPLEIWRHVLAVNEHGAQYFLPNIAISIAQGMIYRTLHALLELVIGSPDAGLLFDHLTAWCETKTGQINKELFELAILVRQNEELAELLRGSDSRELITNNSLAAFPSFDAQFQRFLRDHGHREADFDAYAATWDEAPWIVLDNIGLILQTAMDCPPREKERELKMRAQQAEVTLFAKVPADLRFFFHELVRLARTYTSLDDLEHYQTTRLTPVLRRGLRALGERLVQQDVLMESMDIFFGHQQQIERVLTADSADARKQFSAEISRQKAAYLAAKTRTPAWIFGQTESATSTVADEPEQVLTGLPGSPGLAEGPVFLVVTPDDFAKFPRGAVLVARTTSPTWTPLFYSAAAVVTESGGPLSHGAVTAREMRIPAVMSVRRSLTRLKNGQRVRVDGGGGRVELLGAE